MVRQRSAKPPSPVQIWMPPPEYFHASPFRICGSNSVVECNLAKVEVAGSNPVSRSIFFTPHCGSNSAVECQLPKLKVAGSNPVSRSRILRGEKPYKRMAYDENRKPFLRLWCGFGCDYSVIGTKLVQNISESILYPSHIIMPSKARIIGNLTYYSETIKIKPAQKTTQEQKKLSRARRRNRVTLCIPNSTILMNVRMPST